MLVNYVVATGYLLTRVLLAFQSDVTQLKIQQYEY